MASREAMFANQLAGEHVQCQLCAHRCSLAPGEWGTCGVRRNEYGVLHSHVYGRATALNIDPIEKKPLFHFLPGSLSLSIGTAGCNFRCDYCQNWELSQLRLDGCTGDEPPHPGPALTPAALVDHALSHGIAGISYTYNEPTVFIEYAMDTMELAQSAGLTNVFVSNGYMSPGVLRELAPTLDAINIDLKSFDDAFYQRHCQARLAPVLQSIELAHELGIWVEVTTLLIPGVNNSACEVKALTGFIENLNASIPWHVTAFHPDYKMPDGQHTAKAELLAAWYLGREAGLHHVYVGNILDEKHSSTYCPACGKLVVKRGWGAPTEILISGSCCPDCSHKIAGVWS